MTEVIDIPLETILAKLRALAPAIRAEGVTRLAVFGSRARGDARPDRDHQQMTRFASHRLLAAGLFLLLSCAAAPAADRKPDIALKTKAVDISVFLDPGIKSDPALAANCLNEARKWGEQKKAEGGREQSEGWTYERHYGTRSVVANRYVSILRDDYRNTGGAHPNSDIDTILWDRTIKARISIRPFFTDTSDNGPMLKAARVEIINSIAAEKKKRGADTEWQLSLEPKLLAIGPVTLAPSTESGKSSGLTFHYAPYAIGPYAEGRYLAFVPWNALKPYLTPEGAAIFGGERPKGDDEGPL